MFGAPSAAVLSAPPEVTNTEWWLGFSHRSLSVVLFPGWEERLNSSSEKFYKSLSSCVESCMNLPAPVKPLITTEEEAAAAQRSRSDVW